MHEGFTVLLVNLLALFLYFINRRARAKHKKYVENYTGDLLAENLVEII